MKRSLAVSLVLMSSTVLVACNDSTVESAVYQNVDQCIAGKIYTPEKCAADFAAAKQSHVETAPAYANRADCEAEFGAGQCQTQQTQAGGSIFMPLMLGYMMGSMMNNNAMAPQAMYRQNGRQGFVNANGARVSGTGPVRFSSSSALARPALQRTQVLSRGGFGARAHSVSS